VVVEARRQRALIVSRFLPMEWKLLPRHKRTPAKRTEILGSFSGPLYGHSEEGLGVLQQSRNKTINLVAASILASGGGYRSRFANVLSVEAAAMIDLIASLTCVLPSPLGFEFPGAPQT